MRLAVELSVDSLTGALAADALGADRVELCGASRLGGLTPSHGLLAAALRGCAHSEVHVLIRPREGDFCYSRDEVSVMLADIAHAVDAGATGVVVGALTRRREVDPAVVADLVAAADGRCVTFHRALDVVRRPLSSLAVLAELGISRVLSSGQAGRAEDGAPTLAAMVGAAGESLTVMACGGIRAHNAVSVLRATGVRDLHAAPRRSTALPVDAGDVDFGDHDVFDEREAARLVAAVRDIDA